MVQLACSLAPLLADAHETQDSDAQILDFPASKSCEKIQFFVKYPVLYSATAAQTDLYC